VSVRCGSAFLGGCSVPLGAKVGAEGACDRLRCTSCDFKVCIFEDMEWDASRWDRPRLPTAATRCSGSQPPRDAVALNRHAMQWFSTKKSFTNTAAHSPSSPTHIVCLSLSHLPPSFPVPPLSHFPVLTRQHAHLVVGLALMALSGPGLTGYYILHPSGSDYLFFRNNTPDASKLAAKLNRQPGEINIRRARYHPCKSTLCLLSVL